MKINKKQIISAVFIVVCTVINIINYKINTPNTFIVGLVDSEATYSLWGERAFDIVLTVLYFTSFLGMLPWGTVIASLLGGNAVGLITAMLTGVFTMYETQLNDLLLINILMSAACIIFRKKNFLGKKRAVPAAAAVLMAIFAIRLLFVKYVDLSYIYAFVLIYLWLLVLLFICRKFVKKTEKYFPATDSELENVYRKHSIKQRLLIIINISATLLAAFFIVLSTVQYHSKLMEDVKETVYFIDNMIAYECGEEIAALKTAEDVNNFDDTPIKNILYNAQEKLHISQISFYENIIYEDSGIPVIGAIAYDYTADGGMLTITSRRLSLNEVSPVEDYFDSVYGDVGIVYTAEPADMWDLYNYVLNMLAIAASMFVILNIFIVWLIDEKIVIPLNSMTAAASEFAYDTDERRALSMEKFKALEISSGDEIEQLYLASMKTMNDMNYQIIHIREQAKNISDMQHNIIMTMADIVESRDENTGGHIRRTADYVRIITEQLRENEKFSDILTDEYVKDMIVAAPLHDIGKIHISDTILNKPGKLDDDEFTIMKSHASAGREMLKNATATLGAFSYLDIAVQMAAYHHEKWNGTGYPERKSGDDIPLCARIMAVADVFDALTSKRCYKDAMPLEKAYDIIRNDSGTAFDPDVVDAFFAASDKIEAVLGEFNSFSI